MKFGQNCEIFVKILKFGQPSEHLVILKIHDLVWFELFDLGLRAQNINTELLKISSLFFLSSLKCLNKLNTEQSLIGSSLSPSPSAPSPLYPGEKALIPD